MTNQEIYEQIVQLTSEIKASCIAEKLFSAAREHEKQKFNRILEDFKDDELYQRIVKLGEEYLNCLVDGEEYHEMKIFGKEHEANTIFVFDSKIIHAPSFLIFLIFANIQDDELFEDQSDFVNQLKSEGLENLAEFVNEYILVDFIRDTELQENLYELLTAIFEGNYREYCENIIATETQED